MKIYNELIELLTICTPTQFLGIILLIFASLFVIAFIGIYFKDLLYAVRRK